MTTILAWGDALLQLRCALLGRVLWRNHIGFHAASTTCLTSSWVLVDPVANMIDSVSWSMSSSCWQDRRQGLATNINAKPNDRVTTGAERKFIAEKHCRVKVAESTRSGTLCRALHTWPLYKVSPPPGQGQARMIGCTDGTTPSGRCMMQCAVLIPADLTLFEMLHISISE